MRIIATMLVVIEHSVYLMIGAAHGGVDYVLPENISQYYYLPVFEHIRFLSDWVYQYHMPLFFFLSGAVLGMRKEYNLGRFIKGKIRRLLIPYFICGWFFMMPVKYLSGFYTLEGMWMAMTRGLTGGDSGHLWFLPALFWCMVIFLLVKKTLEKLRLDNMYLLLAVSGLLSVAYTVLPVDLLLLKKGISYSVWFALGYVFEWKRKTIKAWGSARVFAVLCVLAALTWLQYRYDLFPSVLVILLGIGRIYLLSKLCLLYFSGFLKSATGKLLNRNLFNIYLFHDPLEFAVLKVFFDYNFLTTGKGCAAFYFCRLIIIPLASVGIGEVIHVALQFAKKYRMKMEA